MDTITDNNSFIQDFKDEMKKKKSVLYRLGINNNRKK